MLRFRTIHLLWLMTLVAFGLGQTDFALALLFTSAAITLCVLAASGFVYLVSPEMRAHPWQGQIGQGGLLVLVGLPILLVACLTQQRDGPFSTVAIFLLGAGCVCLGGFLALVVAPIRSFIHQKRIQNAPPDADASGSRDTE